MHKITYGILALLIVILVGFGLLRYADKRDMVTGFESCVAAGNPVMESYPEQCREKDGKVFVRDIGNVLEKTDLIRVSTPRPGDVVSSPLVIMGEARGYWFFEASFPVTITDKKGNVLKQHYAQADGEWMTESFVPFKSTVEFTVPVGINSGYLVLSKDNPSGLAEHDDEVRFPIKF